MEEMIEKKALELVKEAENNKPSLKIEIDKSKSYAEQAKDFVGAMATEKAIQDEELQKKLTDTKKDELLNDAEANKKKEEAENKSADKKLQEADYGVYEGVATYAGIKKPLPSKMQKVLFSILSAIQTIYLLVIGSLTSVVNITCDCFDSTVKKISSIAKSARILVLSLLGIGGIAFIIYIGINLLHKYNIIG